MPLDSWQELHSARFLCKIYIQILKDLRPAKRDRFATFSHNLGTSLRVASEVVWGLGAIFSPVFQSCNRMFFSAFSKNKNLRHCLPKSGLRCGYKVFQSLNREKIEFLPSLKVRSNNFAQNHSLVQVPNKVNSCPKTSSVIEIHNVCILATVQRLRIFVRLRSVFRAPLWTFPASKNPRSFSRLTWRFLFLPPICFFRTQWFFFWMVFFSCLQKCFSCYGFFPPQKRGEEKKTERKRGVAKLIFRLDTAFPRSKKTQ